MCTQRAPLSGFLLTPDFRLPFFRNKKEPGRTANVAGSLLTPDF